MTAFGIEPDPTQDVRWFAEMVMSAAPPWSTGNTGGASRIIHGIVGELHGEHERAALGWAVTSILHERIGWAWERNWQPVDLGRLVARRHKEPVRALLADAVAEHVDQYAESTLDPEWRQQLAQMGARVWWRPDESYPLARGRQLRDWHLLVTSSVELIATLSAVPPIEKIGPAPGEQYHHPDSAPDVEPKVLERVRRLLAKAESTTFEAEAETFTAGAQSLMARHSIDAAVLAASEQTTGGPAMRRIGVSNPYESPKVNLLNGIAAANRARAVWSKHLGFVTVIGHTEDLDAVETLFTSLLVQATSTMTRHGSRRDSSGRSRTAAFRRSFLTAFAVRIGERLHEAADAEVTRAAGEVEGHGGSGGQALVPLLEQRRDAVDSLVDEQFPHLRQQRPTVVSDGEGWVSGRTAADRASLGVATPVEGNRG